MQWSKDVQKAFDGLKTAIEMKEAKKYEALFRAFEQERQRAELAEKRAEQSEQKIREMEEQLRKSENRE